jgi:hypothetical protein
VLVYLEQATVPLVRLARWEPADADDEAMGLEPGWYSYENSGTKIRLWWTPTHWAPFEPPAEA